MGTSKHRHPKGVPQARQPFVSQRHRSLSSGKDALPPLAADMVDEPVKDLASLEAIAGITVEAANGPPAGQRVVAVQRGKAITPSLAQREKLMLSSLCLFPGWRPLFS